MTQTTLPVIVNGRFSNGLDVCDVLAVLLDLETIAATAKRCGLAEDDVECRMRRLSLADGWPSGAVGGRRDN